MSSVEIIAYEGMEKLSGKPSLTHRLLEEFKKADSYSSQTGPDPENKGGGITTTRILVSEENGRQSPYEIGRLLESKGYDFEPVRPAGGKIVFAVYLGTLTGQPALASASAQPVSAPAVPTAGPA